VTPPIYEPGDQVEFDQDPDFLGTPVTVGTVIKQETEDPIPEECPERDFHDHEDLPPSYLVQPNDPLAKAFVFCECELRHHV
jgi:hypothetical protein